jgi:chromosome transmission fidelity protein 4
MSKEIVTKYGHGAGPCGIEFTTDGDRVITCGSDAYVKVRPTKGKDTAIKSIENKGGEVNTIALSSDGKKLFIGTDDAFVKEYSFPGCVFTRNILRLTLPVKHVACAGDLVAVASDGPIVHLVSTAGNPIQFECKGHSENVKSVSFDPQLKYLASSSCDGSVRVWDVLTKQCVREIHCMPKDDGSTDIKCRMAWSPSGAHLALPSQNNVLVIERDTWATLYTLMAHSNLVSLVAWSVNGTHLASAAMDNKLILWDASSQEPMSVWKHTR